METSKGSPSIARRPLKSIAPVADTHGADDAVADVLPDPLHRVALREAHGGVGLALRQSDAAGDDGAELVRDRPGAVTVEERPAIVQARQADVGGVEREGLEVSLVRHPVVTFDWRASTEDQLDGAVCLVDGGDPRSDRGRRRLDGSGTDLWRGRQGGAHFALKVARIGAGA